MQYNLVGSDTVTIARQALAAYDLQGYNLVFLRHSDNVTFRAQKPGSENYLMRIHIPITTAMGTHGTDPEMIQSKCTRAARKEGASDRQGVCGEIQPGRVILVFLNSGAGVKKEFIPP